MIFYMDLQNVLLIFTEDVKSNEYLTIYWFNFAAFTQTMIDLMVIILRMRELNTKKEIKSNRNNDI